MQALNTHINEEDQYEDVRVIDLESVGTASSTRDRDASSPAPSSSLASAASPLPSGGRPSPSLKLRRADGSEVVIPPEARDEVVIIASPDTTLVEKEEGERAESRVGASPDMSHVSVVVVGEEKVEVMDSSSSVGAGPPSTPSSSVARAPTSSTLQAAAGGGGIESVNGAGELSDLSRSFSSASHTSSEASSSAGKRAAAGAPQSANSKGSSPRLTSPNSIILEGSTVTSTSTDEHLPKEAPSPRVGKRQNGHAVTEVAAEAAASESSEEDSGIQSKPPPPPTQFDAERARQKSPPPEPPTPEPQVTQHRKTRRGISEPATSNSSYYKQQQQQQRQQQLSPEDEEEEPVELRRKPRRHPPPPELDERPGTPETVPVLKRKEGEVVGGAVSRKTPLTKEDVAKMNLKRKTRKRTRKFEIDGVVVTTTTSKVIYGDEENERFYDEHYFRKQELRELKLLQKQEQKQFQDLAFKNQVCREQQEKRFDQERAVLVRNYENDLQSMSEQQRKQVDKAEEQQHVDLKVTSKKIRAEQEKELKAFRESLKQEVKLLKHEVELLPKDRRKDELKARRAMMEKEQALRERAFLDRLNDSHETSLRRLSDTHKEKIALLDRQFLQQKQQLMRAREAALWEMEERHLHEKHQLAKRQLKDMFFLQRHQMLVRFPFLLVRLPNLVFDSCLPISHTNPRK